MVEWRDIPGYEGYYSVSEFGDAMNARTRRILSPRYVTDRSHFNLSREGNVKSVSAHRLVAFAFLGDPPEEKTFVLHSDGNHRNNHWSNLRWGNNSENQLDSVRHGTHWGSSRTHCVNGHLFDDRNTYTCPRGKRQCRVCRAAAVRRSYQKGGAR